MSSNTGNTVNLQANVPDAQVRCLGLPCTGQKSLSEPEQKELRRLTQPPYLKWQFWVGATPFAIGIVAYLFGLFLAEPKSDFFYYWYYFGDVSLALLSGICLPNMIVLFGANSVAVRQAATKEQNWGLLKIYEGVLPPMDHLNQIDGGTNVYRKKTMVERVDEVSPGYGAILKVLSDLPPSEYAIGEITIDLVSELHIEVFETTRRLWRVNGERTKRAVFLPEIVSR